MITLTALVIDYNRSPSMSRHRVTLYGSTPAKGDCLEALEAMSCPNSEALSIATLITGTVSKVTWHGVGQLTIEVLGVYKEKTYGPVSP